MADGDDSGGAGIVSERRWRWCWSPAMGLSRNDGGGVFVPRRRVWGSGGACGLLGAPFKILKTQVDGFFRYEANGVGGETQKRRLEPRLGVFQILGFR